MFSQWQPQSSLIDRVRMSAAGTEAIAARQSLEHLLSGASLRASRLPSSAILIVRKLQHRMPTCTPAYHNHAQVAEWERSLNVGLDSIAAEAAHPALGAVPAGAQAVCFSDRAEMLSSLALDWMQGTLRSHWWWQTLLRGDNPDVVVAREWTSSPEFAPLAVEYLAMRWQAVAFARRISDDVAATLLSRVLQVFAIRTAARFSQSDHRDEIVSHQAGPSQKSSAIDAPPVEQAPWSGAVPEADAPELTPGRRILLAQMLMLRRAPSTARGAAFQTRLTLWEVAAVRIQPHSSSPLEQHAPEHTLADMVPAEPKALEGREKIAGHPAISPQPSDDFAAPAPEASDIVDYEPPLAREPRPQAGVARAQAQPAPADSPATSERADLETTTPLPAEMVGVDEAAQTAVARKPETLPAIALGQRVQCALAGAFFLINVALAMELYSDFAAPRGENLELNIWDFVALMARQFMGEELNNDGLNFALVTLAEREPAQPPGEGFDAPAEWHVPPEWLDAFPEFFEWNEVTREGRAQVEHPAGFLMKDVPAAGEHAYSNLQRWVGWVAGYVGARLARALGRDDAAQFLCRVGGTIEIRPIHVDIHYSLQSYPTEIRLAGLDRDPGWVPVAGRYVAYHFE